MIVVTGAAGFIGSVLLGRLETEGYGQLVAVDDFSNPLKHENLNGKKIFKRVEREVFHEWLDKNGELVQFVFHIGARTDTAEMSEELLNHLNFNYSKEVWTLCVKHSIPLIYASSAATYGSGENGFNDDCEILGRLKPLNPYGWSKHRFDIWVNEQVEKPPFWAGFKFFNVYGPNEYHKGRMASVVYHSFHQIQKTGSMKLFRSHREDYKDGQQLRDFIFVKDVADVLLYFMEHRKYSDLYNLGTGNERSFSDLTNAVFTALGKSPDIQFIDIPEDIRETYQYYTSADMNKLRNAGYIKPFTTLEAGVREYVNLYLEKSAYC